MTSHHLRIRRMTETDLDQVCLIDQLSFSLPWPATSFHYEITGNLYSTCWVAEIGPESALKTTPSSTTQLSTIALQTTDNDISGNGKQDLVVGMAVVWLVVDEAHIATIAVHPDFRGLGIGKQLLAVILEDSWKRGMVTATLEVRAGNQVAQTMYGGFGFEVMGIRRHYYKDNQEDALIMTADLGKTFGVSETPKVSKPKASKSKTAEGD